MSNIEWHRHARLFQKEMLEVPTEDIDLKMRRFVEFFRKHPWINIYTRYCCEGHLDNSDEVCPQGDSAYLMLAGDPNQLNRLLDVIQLANKSLIELGHYSDSELEWNIEIGLAVLDDFINHGDRNGIYTSHTLRSSVFHNNEHKSLMLDCLYGAITWIYGDGQKCS